MSGFSAEMSMADKELVEKRAKNYEKNWKKRYAVFATTAVAMSVGLPLAIRKGLMAKNMTQFAKKWTPRFDYNDGIYMSRAALILGCFGLSQMGTMLATRNKTELKDTISRFTTTDVIFFGGDIFFSSLFSKLSDKFLGTQLSKPSDGKKLSKILPPFKSLKEVNEEVKAGKIAAKNKPIALALWWTNMSLIVLSVGLLVPNFVNAVTRRDIEKDKNKHKKTDYNPVSFEKNYANPDRLKSLLI